MKPTFSTGKTFQQALSEMTESDKITFGTASNQWHILYKGDRDYSAAPDKKTAESMGESATLVYVLSPRMV